MSTCCKPSSINSKNSHGSFTGYVQKDMGSKLKSIVRAIALKRVPSISEIVAVSDLLTIGTLLTL